MGISPWRVGQVTPTWTFEITTDSGSPLNLTGVTAGQCSLLLYNAAFASVATGGGTFTLPTPLTSGLLTYAPIAADTSGLAAGQYYVRVEVNFSGTSPFYSDFVSLVIQN